MKKYNISRFPVAAENVIGELKKYILADGYDFVIDLEKSKGSYFYDKRSGKKFLDFFSCFASLPIGMNHPKIKNKEFMVHLANISANKPSNSDVYSDVLASFIKTFFKIAVPRQFKHSFFISGGALAVENALKTAFDWKVKKNFLKGYKYEKGSQIIHFKQSFHGRSGYTMSLTNTDPVKTDYFPKFDWPRITNPKIIFPINENLDEIIKLEKKSINEIKLALKKNKDDIAAIIIEPIQGEGGDNHFRKEFLQNLRLIADENDLMLIFDEVQTGLGLTGKWWAYQHFDVIPDILVFGKKMQVCGIIVTERVDEIENNVFRIKSRINSTWGGNLTDMARAAKYLEIIDEEKLVKNAQIQGNYLMKALNNFHRDFPEFVTNQRGRGLFCAFDLPSKLLRDNLVRKTFENGLFILPSGDKTLRFRPPLNISQDEIDKGLEIIKKSLKTII